MRINGDGHRDTCEINLRLKSTNRKLQWHIRPGYGLVPDDKNGRADIIFNDSYEVDQLIEILQRFKEENQRCFGAWR